ncbi:rhomboid family intramembrane serine protease [Marinicella sp. S1101]|uniref:rhomboid family intramembrane serine protease n=1 Tax=Marinicella marina TaxID=2996016 RepID=UPI002260861E|nr:rhomboid family intramembrane serine protease [Marinicella marina]MCX7552792.1 rhomboid family intramembrane serine protease [Marinicella marina]MDJ1139899.1 rhomboid family intramembrane serine protease [Marinicella marina]
MINFSNRKPSYFPYVSMLVFVVFLLFLLLNEFTVYGSQIMALYAIKTREYWSSISTQPFELFRLLTATFLHGNILHWVINNTVFLLLAFTIERVIGGQKFLSVFLLSGIIGNLSASYFLQEQNNLLMGASGAVSGLIGLWLVMFPHKKINFVLPIGLYFQKTSMPLAVIILLWLVVQLILQFQPHPSYDIAWISHIMGFSTGFVLAWFVK